MTNLREAAQMALDALEEMTRHFSFSRLGESRLADTTARGKAHEAAKALRAALAQPEPEPEMWVRDKRGWVGLHEQPQREWQGLTDEEINSLYETCGEDGGYEYERAIEAKLKEKNA